MKKRTLLAFCLIALSAAMILSCSKDPKVATPLNAPVLVSVESFIPRGFSSKVVDLNLRNDNPLTVQGIALGRRLFYDPLLSGNNKQSCGSCHIQKYAFSNGLDFALSLGADGFSKTRRNAPTTFNLLWAKSFTWDGGQPNLEEQVVGPITNPVEMNQDISLLANELQADPNYPYLFKKAFGTDSITVALVAKALAQFERIIVSGDSKFDLWAQRKINLSNDELEGYAIFQSQTLGDCIHCHSAGNTFTNFDFKHNGLDTAMSGTQVDVGRFGVTHQGFDSMMFKTPTLRNIALTAPYMHDGRFKTLEEVVEFYDHGFYRNRNLDVNMMMLPKYRMSTTQKMQLVAFLKTLTDTSLTKDLRYSTPF
ncbi:MAG: c-type cytochrome [Bacteroidetes bacterium]|nr:c-type cytochrome [Bacteroidota bacterium]